MINRRKSKKVRVGNIYIGADAPITIQSMTNTDTRNVLETIAQIKKLEKAGCDIVRVAAFDMDAAKAISTIKKEIKIPLVADIHFDYRLAIEAIKNGADKIRLNPGNIGSEIGSLLLRGLGDTLRVSLTGDPVNEIELGKDILKYLGIRNEGIEIISCPTCGRCNIDLESIVLEVEDRIKELDKNITIAIMGCAVNGPGEASNADIGIAGGNGEALIFRKGKILRKVKEDDLIEELILEINKL